VTVTEFTFQPMLRASKALLFVVAADVARVGVSVRHVKEKKESADTHMTPGVGDTMHAALTNVIDANEVKIESKIKQECINLSGNYNFDSGDRSVVLSQSGCSGTAPWPYIVSGSTVTVFGGAAGLTGKFTGGANQSHTIVWSNGVTYVQQVSSWVLGNGGETCDATCGATKRVCDADMQSGITDANSMRAASKEAGHVCPKITSGMHRGYAGNPQVGVGSDHCYFLTPGGRSVCDGNDRAHHRPLCYCNTGYLGNSGYHHLPKGCINGHNIAFSTGETVQTCSTKCSEESACLGFGFGFEYKGESMGRHKAGDCLLKRSADLDCKGEDYNLDFYVNVVRR